MTETNGAIRVMLVDDDDLVRRGLRLIVSSDPTLDVVAEAEDGDIALRRAPHHHPDVVLMDVRMPQMDGITATRELIARVPDARVLILTTFNEDEYVVGALRAGASGFLLKRSTPKDLLRAIHVVALGDALLSPAVTQRVIERVVEQPILSSSPDPRLADLTPREAPGVPAHRPRALQPRDRRRADRRGDDGQEPRPQRADEAQRTRPHPRRDPRLRMRRGLPRQADGAVT